MPTNGVFKRRAVPAEQVAAAERTAAAAPIVGDPRIGATEVQPIYVIGQSYNVPLERIRSNPVNPRAVYTPQAVDEMAVSLAQNGQRVPATGYVDDDGAVVLIEGETRLRGARLGDLKTLRVEIQERSASERELYLRARAANVERRDQTPLDDALKWKDLLERKVFTSQAGLAQELKLPESTVSRILNLANLPHKVVMMLADHPSLLNFQMLNAVREYFEACGEDEVIEYIPQIAKNGWGYRRVAEDTANSKKAPVRRPRGTKEPLAFAGGKGEIKTFDNGRRIEVTLKDITDVDKVAAFVEGLKALAR